MEWRAPRAQPGLPGQLCLACHAFRPLSICVRLVFSRSSRACTSFRARPYPLSSKGTRCLNLFSPSAWATPDDAEVLQAIYAPYVETTVTFRVRRSHRGGVPPAHYRSRERVPHIVCEEDGVPVGYAYASRLYERAAYAWAVELSVYFAPNHRGRGMGRKIYDKMLSRC